MSHTPFHSRPPSLTRRAVITAEVLAVFAVVHASYRAFKHFTAPGGWESAHGLNYSPGLAMMLAMLLALLATRRRPSEYGLTLANWSRHLTLGLVWGLVPAVGAGVLVALAGFRARPGQPPPTTMALIGAVGELLLIAPMLLSVRRFDRLSRRVPAPIGIVVLAAVFASPVLAALYSQHSSACAVAVVSELVLCAGLGEEVFFRGYVQSRLNMAYGRPFLLLGVHFGVGLLVSALLFGVIHSLNTVDYFSGQFRVAWAWGVMNVSAGLLLGFLRERTGSIVPGAIAHAVTDVLEQIPAFLEAI